MWKGAERYINRKDDYSTNLPFLYLKKNPTMKKKEKKKISKNVLEAQMNENSY